MEKLERIKYLCEKRNIPPFNLLHKDFVDEEISKLYDEATNLDEKQFPPHGSFRVWNYLGDNVKIDRNREAKTMLWDIGIIVKRNVVYDYYPEISKHVKDGLVEVEKNFMMNKNGFEFKNHYLILDCELYQNHSMISYLIGKFAHENFRLSFLINPHALGIKGTEREMHLKSFWYGVKGIEKIDPNANNHVVLGPSNSRLRIQDKTEFYLRKTVDSKYGKCWILEIEEHIPFRVSGELEPDIYGGEKKYSMRYIHAYISDDFRRCYHIDGAYRCYNSKDSFLARSKMALHNKALKKLSTSYKLFKIDSEEGIDFYQELIGLFFYFNPYIEEFFRGEISEFNAEIENRRECFLDLNVAPSIRSLVM